MNTVELLEYALDTAFGVLARVTSDVTQEQADWMPPGIANPIGATYWHAVSGADDIVHHWVLGQAPLYQRDGWEEKVLTVSAPKPDLGGDYQIYYRTIRVDMATLHEYAQAVGEAVQGWLCSLDPADLEEQVETPVGEMVLGEMVETFLVWHIDAHCGEIAALKGCQGVKGYPF